jgi:NADH-quinone oxidoreductase subunit M
VLQQINHGISTGALFLIVGILYERRHTREISEYGGISNVMPVYATITLIMFLSSMGLPLLNGFVGEFTILQGTFMENWKWAHGRFREWCWPRPTCCGSTSECSSARSPIRRTKSCMTSRRAKCDLRSAGHLAFWIGLYPKPFFQILRQPVHELVDRVEHNGYYKDPAPVVTPVAAAPACCESPKKNMKAAVKKIPAKPVAAPAAAAPRN